MSHSAGENVWISGRKEKKNQFLFYHEEAPGIHTWCAVVQLQQAGVQSMML